MSDLEKVVSFANKLGASRPIQLRWEGAGDCGHVAKLLGSLKHKTYDGTSQAIKYHATVNLYEPETDPVFTKASELLAVVHAWPKRDYQTYEIKGGVDVTRNSRLYSAQKTTHIMFVRNIMPTTDGKNSEVGAADVLQSIHETGLRNRANSIEKGGSVRLGMSGAPGLIGASQEDRKATPVKKLFVKAKQLVEAASIGGLQVDGSPDRPGADDFDEGGVMKNNGKDLGIKPTYYLTFVSPQT